jgi:hypothetical protein
MRKECLRILREEARERGITLRADEPDEMAEELFRNLGG